MDLNRIRLLSEVNLLKAIKESGNENIADILRERCIDGKSFLEFQELQAISWKLPRIQIKSLTTFIMQVKQNPSLLTKYLPASEASRHIQPVPPKPKIAKPPLRLPGVPKVENVNTRPTKPELKVRTNSDNPPTIIKPVEIHQTPKSEPPIATSKIRERPALPLPRWNANTPTEPPEDPKTDYGYLTPEDIGTKYPPLADQSSPKQRTVYPPLADQSSPKQRTVYPPLAGQSSPNQRSVHDKASFLSSKLSKAANNSDNEDINDGPALPAPRIEQNKSPVCNRKLPPIPTDSTEIKRRSPNLSPSTKRKFQQVAPVKVEDDDDDANIYDHVEEEEKNKKHLLRSETIQQPTQPDPIKKYSVGNQEYNYGADKDNQIKRTNFLENLGSIGKFLGVKVKPTKTDGTNYENHMLQSETTHITKNSLSFKDRPLPEIPKEYQPGYRKQSFGSSDKIPNSTVSTLQRKTSEKGLNQSATHFQQNIRHEPDDVDDEELVYENVKEQNNTNDEDEFDAPEYENNESLGLVSKQNVLSRAILAHSLNKDLSTRPIESSITREIKQNEEIRSTRNVPLKQDDQEEEEPVFYGNIDQPTANPYFSKQSPFRDNIPLDNEQDIDAPEYGNIDESEIRRDRQQATNRNNYNPHQYERNDTPISHIQPQSGTRASVSSILAMKLNEAIRAREKKIQENMNKSKIPNKSNFAKIATPSDRDGEEEDYKAERNVLIRKQIPDDAFNNQGFHRNVISESIRHGLNEHDSELNEVRQSKADLIFNINHEPFYRNTDRKGAKQLLRNFADGAFLFRPSEKYFLVLTIKYNKKFYNLGIERTANNKIRLNADTSSISPEFDTLKAFVDYFKKEAVTFSDHDTILEIYLNPVLPADIF